MSAGIDFTYNYAFASSVQQSAKGRPQLSLATCDANQSQPYFFDGRVRNPRMLGEMLYVLSDVVRTHFFLPKPAILDPVVTNNEDMLRLEGFSGCCGVYARVDLPASGFDGECKRRGTTNVDFNNDMRAALLRLRDEEDVEFAVGADEVVLSRDGAKTVEKKVKLPLRWIKGFSEVQSYQPRLEPRIEVSAAEGLRFMRDLPKSPRPKMPSYAIPSGRSMRLTQRNQNGAVQILGTHRVKVIEHLLIRAKGLRVWSDEGSGASAWEVIYPEGTFFLMISPEVYRGFSGEGQLLRTLAVPPPEASVAKVRAALKWQSQVDAAKLAQFLGLTDQDVEGALGILGTRGLAGYDATNGHYFHRELPFDLAKVEEMQPRLGHARQIVETGKVRRVGYSTEPTKFEVDGTGTVHLVSLSESGDSCTCPWFSKYQGQRGACKHVLAATLLMQEQEEGSINP
ncbi:MAG: SWIM zinc finger domain-containing protein [Burkholderiales bacterium]|nr:SWIM zinc finger domain-containing protein [Burkholderiales bacterium]